MGLIGLVYLFIIYLFIYNATNKKFRGELGVCFSHCMDSQFYISASTLTTPLFAKNLLLCPLNNKFYRR